MVNVAKFPENTNLFTFDKEVFIEKLSSFEVLSKNCLSKFKEIW